ncbi:MAG: zinc ribbon domain-containing protein [Verrucomicrobia bacterium]|nr:zinc ribbon domain-containing protein [Verrucomicrobiota bacterium]MBS0646613.1 zinc ribbon domain-containing protein [Verrucomicrobiota bacterium]
MQDSFHMLLSIQELDIKMIRLMRVKNERKKELEKLHLLQQDVKQQVEKKETQIKDIKMQVRLGETQIKEIEEKVARLEQQQSAVKKMDEFNALTHEMTQAGRERHMIEQKLSDLLDKQTGEEELLVALKENLKATHDNSTILEGEILESINKINQEGRELLEQREVMTKQVNGELFKIYERLLKNKKDRVLVPIENRTCSGCHIVLTPQHENLVRQGDRLVFCEHCSRVLFWPETSVAEEGEETGTTRRRRKKTQAVSA